MGTPATTADRRSTPRSAVPGPTPPMIAQMTASTTAVTAPAGYGVRRPDIPTPRSF